MSHQSAAFSSGSNSIPFADWTIGRFTLGLPKRSKCLQLGTPRTLVHPCSSPPLVEPLEFHAVDPATILHVNDNLDWVDAPIPIPTPVFQTPPVTDHNPVNNQLAKALWQLSENLNRGSAPKPHQSKACILDTFDSSDPTSSITSYSNANSFFMPTLRNFPPMKRKSTSQWPTSPV